MNKKKRIKKFEERTVQLERARSIHNEYWQTRIVGLEQRIEVLEARPTCYPVFTTGGTIVEWIRSYPEPVK